MKRLPITLIVLFALTASLSTYAFGWGSIAGKVYDETTLDPLAGHYVHACEEPGGTVIEWAETDIYGRYTLYELDAGSYYVWVSGGDLCVSEWWENTPDSTLADPVEVVDGELTENIDFGLECVAGYGCITGRVVDEATSDPIKGAVIKVYTDTGGPPVADAVTGDWGYYEVCELPEGVYYVHAHAERCEGEWYNEKVHPADADPVEVLAGETADGISFTLTCEASGHGCIVGKVTDGGTGLPINDAHVLVHADPLGDPIADARTDYKGFYEICKLEPGDYYVWVKAEGCEGEWYNDKYNPEDADPVTVVAGEVTDHIDFVLECIPRKGCIEGRVVDQDTGEPIHEAHILAYTNPHGDPVADAYTGEKGYYELCGLEPGVYYVKAGAWECEDEWFEDKSSPEEADPVEVNAGKVTYGVSFRLDCGHPGSGCIVGRVFDEETEEPIVHALVRVHRGRDHRPVAKAFTGEEGWYEICDLEPGVYYASAHARKCQREWYHNKTTPDEADPIEVHAGEVVDGINFTLLCRHPGTGCIVGRATDEEGHPIRNAFVAVVGTPGGDPIRYTFTGENGFYEICKLKPGVYYAVAHAKGCDREWYNGKARAEDADPIEVHAGEIVDRINFTLQCPGANLCITGTVVDEETGEGINDALVIAVRLDRPYFKLTFTNERGHYELCGLRHGKYIVFAFAWGYIGEFYDDVYRWEDATPVVPPEDGINFRLGERTRKSMSVRGRVFSRMGPVPNAMVYAYTGGTTAGGGTPVSSALTEIDGSYSIDGLPAGTYVITASRPGDPTTSYSEPVSVESSVEGIDIHLGSTSVRKGTGNDGAIHGQLLRVMPNPFRKNTQFSLAVPDEADVRLEIFDLTGRSVARLVDGTLPAGEYEIEWDAGQMVSGIYIAKLSCGDRTTVTKVVLAR